MDRMGGGSGQPFLGDFLQTSVQFGEVRPVLALKLPTEDQDVLDVPRGLEVGQGRPHASSYGPDDGFRRLLLPRPFAGQQLVPDGAEGVDVAGLGEGQVLSGFGRLDAQGSHDFRRQIAEPAFWNAHAVPETTVDMFLMKQWKQSIFFVHDHSTFRC